MELDLLQALLTILKSCYKQDDCRKCPMRKICGKIPTEWGD